MRTLVFLLAILPILSSCGGGSGDEGEVPRGFSGTVFYQIAAGDLDGDGFTDIAAIAVVQDGDRSTPDPTQLQVILQDSFRPGHFSVGQRLPMGSPLGAVKIADLDGEGHPDIAVTEPQNNTVRVLLQDPATAGRFVQGGVFSAGDRVTSMEVAEFPDVDLDGAPDLVTTTPNGVLLLRQDGGARGTFPPDLRLTIDDTLSSDRALSDERDGLAIGDLNADGLMDVATVRSDIDRVRIYFHDGAVPGTFNPASTLPLSLNRYDGLGTLSLGDIDGDGLTDVIAAGDRYVGEPMLYVRQQNPAAPGTFLRDRNFKLGNDGSPSQLILEDVTSDGLPDVLIAKVSVVHFGFIEVLAQSGPPFMLHQSGVFTTLPLRGVEPFLRGFAVADLNADGLPDIAVTDGELAVLFNDPDLPKHFQPARRLLE